MVCYKTRKAGHAEWTSDDCAHSWRLPIPAIDAAIRDCIQHSPLGPSCLQGFYAPIKRLLLPLSLSLLYWGWEDPKLLSRRFVVSFHESVFCIRIFLFVRPCIEAAQYGKNKFYFLVGCVRSQLCAECGAPRWILRSSDSNIWFKEQLSSCRTSSTYWVSSH